VLSAITGQIATLGHVSNFFATPAQVALAGRLTAMTGGADAQGVLHQLRHGGQRGGFKITG
jgi:acetylornithine aminotransferase